MIRAAARYEKNEMDTASQTPSYHSGSLWNVYLSGAKVYFRSVSEIFKSIHSFIHLANICSNLLYAGHRDGPWGSKEKQNKTNKKEKQNTFYLLKELISNYYRFLVQNVGR